MRLRILFISLGLASACQSLDKGPAPNEAKSVEDMANDNEVWNPNEQSRFKARPILIYDLMRQTCLGISMENALLYWTKCDPAEARISDVPNIVWSIHEHQNPKEGLWGPGFFFQTFQNYWYLLSPRGGSPELQAYQFIQDDPHFVYMATNWTYPGRKSPSYIITIHEFQVSSGTSKLIGCLARGDERTKVAVYLEPNLNSLACEGLTYTDPVIPR